MRTASGVVPRCCAISSNSHPFSSLSFKTACCTGVSCRATISITDSNLTTIIATVILYQFGTGPIRGFAVTLSLGIVASMFTAIFVSRAIFEYWARKSGPKGISI